MSKDDTHDTITSPATMLDRREFLRVSSALAAAGALTSAGCQVPQESTIPFHDMPEELVDGMGHARFFHTVIDGSPVVVKTREGRPILVTPAAGHPSGRGLSVRHHAALMDLYDPDRARGPLSLRRRPQAAMASSWTVVGTEIVTQLRSAGSKAVLLTGPIDSPALAMAIGAISSRTGLRHITWAPLERDEPSRAWKAAFGHARVPLPRIDQADLIVGLGAEFLDRPEDGLERAFADRRSPDPQQGRRMSRFVQLEGRLTLTGANADRRIRVRDTQLAHVALTLAHELIVVRRIGPLAADAAIARALAPFAVASLRLDITPETLTGIANEMAAAAGTTLVIAGGAASTSASGAALELAAIVLNLTLGAFDAGLFDDHAVRPEVVGSAAAFAALTAEMEAGQIQALLIAGTNPMYDAPASLKLAAALARVPFIVSMNDRLDETSAVADLLAPVSHSFECWSDAALPRGVFAVQQPVIQPLFDTRGLLDVLVDWAAALGDAQAMAAVTAATPGPAPVPTTGQRAPSASLAYHYMRAAWKARLETTASGFESAWTNVLRDGFWRGPTSLPAPRAFMASALDLLTGLPAPLSGIELQLYPHLALADGRAANNAWLHELPDPITRLTWGGALSVAPRRFDDMGLSNGDFVEISAGGTTLVAPAYRHAGMHHDQVALPLGFGRTACGAIGAGIGRNAFPLRPLAAGRLQSAGVSVTIRRVDGREDLAMAQGSDVIDRERRPLVPTTTLSAYEQNAASGTEQVEGGESAWPAHEYPNARWGMAIDLNACNGCGKCVIACQGENNIPVVGRRGMLDGREMSWMRIDRYYDAPTKAGGWDAEVWDGPLEVVEEPQTLFEPMLCQHCENAPCETVCPFSATMHSEDGLNQQIYNRCVGTRYCANNCPFKVRRFNYWEYSKPQESALMRWIEPRIARHAELNTRVPTQMKNNPEVTVRSRGVMEKCSFCVQRVRGARAEATRNGQSKEHLPDGAVVTACMEACPTQAIVFGDRNAPDSRVSALAAHPRAMRLLEALGVKPAISYLTKVRNDKA
jgi:Fe-S-cluster-containing dehydrogenase component